MNSRLQTWTGLALSAAVLFLVQAAPISSAAPSLQSSDTLTVTTEDIGVLPADYMDGSLIVSDDGAEYAYVVQAAGGQQAVVGEQKGEVFSQVGTLHLSPKTNQLFYNAKDGSGSQARIVLVANGEVIPTDFPNPAGLVFSADGEHWAAMGGVSEKGDVAVLLDGNRSFGPYLDAAWPSFSPDGEHIAFLAKTDAGMAIVVDGEMVKTFAPLADTDKASNTIQAYVYGPNLPPWYSLDYLADGSLLVLTQDQNGWSVYKGDELLASYPVNLVRLGDTYFNYTGFDTSSGIYANSLNYAADAPIATWWEHVAGEEDLWRVMIDGKPADDLLCTNSWHSQSPTLSGDGQHSIYACAQKQASSEIAVFVVKDGEQHGPYDDVWGMRLSENGDHFSYAAKDASQARPWSFYLDGQPLSPGYENVYTPSISPDGAHIAWRGLVADQSILGVDGQEISAVTPTDVLWGPVFDESSHAHWIVLDENKIVRVDAALEPSD